MCQAPTQPVNGTDEIRWASVVSVVNFPFWAMTDGPVRRQTLVDINPINNWLSIERLGRSLGACMSP